MNIERLMRPEILELGGYDAPELDDSVVRLHANENPWRPETDQFDNGLNHYPPARPKRLEAALAKRFGIDVDRVMATRGSSDAIDLLVRAFCRPGQDAVVVCPPAFEMYTVYAQIQGAAIKEVPLSMEDGFALPTDAVINAVDETTKIVFLCSPNNPTGNRIPMEDLKAVCRGLSDRAVVVIDEAYVEFCEHQNCIELLEDNHVVLLRTLSKALGLAGLRCGSMLADPVIVNQAKRITPPYAIPTPSIEFALSNLTDSALATADERIRLIRSERSRLQEALSGLPLFNKVWPSDANFVLARSDQPRSAWQSVERSGLLIRVFGGGALEGCVRITVGKPEENDRLLETLSRMAN